MKTITSSNVKHKPAQYLFIVILCNTASCGNSTSIRSPINIKFDPFRRETPSAYVLSSSIEKQKHSERSIFVGIGLPTANLRPQVAVKLTQFVCRAHQKQAAVQEDGLKPLWCEKYAAYSCDDREYFFLGQLPYLTGTECVIYEGINLLVLIVHIFFLISCEGSRIYWKKTVNQLKIFGIEDAYSEEDIDLIRNLLDGHLVQHIDE
ncbi:hypothetical protein K1719_044885 [Acacia pycnantha]|nr:hypothetical protein K1719_044885 [Acacia pycnantha]